MERDKNEVNENKQHETGIQKITTCEKVDTKK